MDNVYYVGGRNRSALRDDTQPQGLRREQQTLSPQPLHNASSSRSCRKTELKYAHLRPDTHRHVSCQRPLPSTARTVRVKKERRQREEECSAISVQPRGRVTFNRVAQPTLLNRMRQNAHDTHSLRKCEQSARRHFFGKAKEPNEKEKEIPMEESCSSQLPEMYRVQPTRRLFLCESCLRFLPWVEVKAHLAQCRRPKTVAEYRHRWDCLAQLLHSLLHAHPDNNPLFRLAHLAAAYPPARRTPQPAPSIYSLELERMLRMQEAIKTEEVRTEDLFWALERAGDALETLPAALGPSCW